MAVIVVLSGAAKRKRPAFDGAFFHWFADQQQPNGHPAAAQAANVVANSAIPTKTFVFIRKILQLNGPWHR
ncbi:hypothetical protein [Novilysobacter erysipheiresistens]|uniref:Uncharacterized protein n=1 Tax=Novilysobacter erysipheiresistens TaxID=1749332 RepID=A0ABU7YZJ0_9GAMM